MSCTTELIIPEYIHATVTNESDGKRFISVVVFTYELPYLRLNLKEYVRDIEGLSVNDGHLVLVSPNKYYILKDNKLILQ